MGTLEIVIGINTTGRPVIKLGVGAGVGALLGAAPLPHLFYRTPPLLGCVFYQMLVLVHPQSAENVRLRWGFQQSFTNI